MVLYTSDITVINELIENGDLQADRVKIINSCNPLHIESITKFINIEEILAPIICDMLYLERLGDFIKTHKKIKHITTYIKITESDYEEVSQTNKHKKRKIAKDPLGEIVKIILPELVKTVGQRMRYINFKCIINDETKKLLCNVIINKGMFTFVGDEKYEIKAEDIFKELINVGALTGIITSGEVVYDLKNLKNLNYLMIIAKNEDDYLNIDDLYLEKLIMLSENVDIVYNSDTFVNYYVYSELIKDNAGKIIQLNAIVPVCDVSHHILYNDLLEEIHIMVHDHKDVNELCDIIDDNITKPITYVVYYDGFALEDYYSTLKKHGDVLFKDIIKSLSS